MKFLDMVEKLDDFPLNQTGKSDKYQERINNRRYREKKRRIQDKLTGVTGSFVTGESWDSMESLYIPKKGSKIGIVAGFTYSAEGKVIEILELTTGVRLETILDKKLPRSLE
jgi:hypothetical protein